MRPRAQRRHLPPAIHTDAGHRAIRDELVRLTLYSRGGVPMVWTLPALIVLVFISAAILAGLLTAILHLSAWR